MSSKYSHFVAALSLCLFGPSLLVVVDDAAAESAATDDTVVADDLPEFVESMAADLNQFWRAELLAQKIKYKPARIQMFDRVVETGCGKRLAKQGVVYCVEDLTVYVPPEALLEFRDELGVPGDMAQAFAIAHELAHHAQLGLHITRDTARRSNKARSKRRKQKLKIAHELQADCFAGLWANSLEERGLLEPGDIEEALGALEAIGDDSLRVPRRRWKHGSGAQRAKWFSIGYDTGDFDACDPFTPKED